VSVAQYCTEGTEESHANTSVIATGLRGEIRNPPAALTKPNTELKHDGGSAQEQEGNRTLAGLTDSGQLSRYSDSLQAGRSGDRMPVVARFSAPVQTGPETHPASYAMGTGSFPGVKRPGRGVDPIGRRG